MKATVAVFAFALTGQVALFAQEAPEQRPRTKLEAFVAQTGTVVIRGFTNATVVRGQYGSSIAVESKEFINANSGKREYGVTIEVKESGRVDREDTSYVDYDELDGLLKGIDYIGKIDKSVTLLDNFQADYRTKGDLEISVFNSGANTMVSVESGRVGKATAFYPLSDLPALRAVLAAAKDKIDSIRKAAN